MSAPLPAYQRVEEAEEEPEIEVRFVTLSGKRFSLSLPVTATVAEVKEALAGARHTAGGLVKLIYRGRVLEDGRTLADYAFASGQTIHVVTLPSAPVAVQPGGAAPVPASACVTPSSANADDGAPSAREVVARVEDVATPSARVTQPAVPPPPEIASVPAFYPPQTLTVYTRGFVFYSPWKRRVLLWLVFLLLLFVLSILQAWSSNSKFAVLAMLVNFYGAFVCYAGSRAVSRNTPRAVKQLSVNLALAGLLSAAVSVAQTIEAVDKSHSRPEVTDDDRRGYVILSAFSICVFTVACFYVSKCAFRLYRDLIDFRPQRVAPRAGAGAETGAGAGARVNVVLQTAR